MSDITLVAIRDYQSELLNEHMPQRVKRDARAFWRHHNAALVAANQAIYEQNVNLAAAFINYGDQTAAAQEHYAREMLKHKWRVSQ
jgi:hypothetical protein